MWSFFMYIILGRGRKSGVAHATAATASLAPLSICLYPLEAIRGKINLCHFGDLRVFFRGTQYMY